VSSAPPARSASSCRPSLALILYGIVAEQSVPRLFLAGILPGLLQAAAFFLWVLYDARKRNFPVEPSLPLAELLRVTMRAVPRAHRAARRDGRDLWRRRQPSPRRRRYRRQSRCWCRCSSICGFHWTETLRVITDGIRSAGTIMLIVATALAFGTG